MAGGWSQDYREKARSFSKKEQAKNMRRRDHLLRQLKRLDDERDGHAAADDDNQEAEDEAQLEASVMGVDCGSGAGFRKKVKAKAKVIKKQGKSVAAQQREAETK